MWTFFLATSEHIISDWFTASNDGDKRTDELCWLLWRRCERCSAANRFVLFTGRRTGFIMITGGCSNYINQNWPSWTNGWYVREARELIWGENFCFPSRLAEGESSPNDMEGREYGKGGVEPARSSDPMGKGWVTSGGEDENADRLSATLRRGRRRCGWGSQKAEAGGN